MSYRSSTIALLGVSTVLCFLSLATNSAALLFLFLTVVGTLFLLTLASGPRRREFPKNAEVVRFRRPASRLAREPEFYGKRVSGGRRH